MKLRILTIGRTDRGPHLDLMEEYKKRIARYYTVSWEELPEGKGDPEEQRNREGKWILDALEEKERLILLDEKGREYTSREWSEWLRKTTEGSGKCTLVTGGAFGFSGEVRKRAEGMIALSKMTFPHQLARVFLAEQLYRAFSILRNEKYHHD
ncbi:MAG: 23S rRNA (pseudouridine(1915)-N(3))-methyltransferase RlmH [Bacteroidia bacterium]|nr:23S rRNA (pseudouridine(1915)-N(3))-methyltransferase RlmH [Bacteroidia bacterium]